MDIIKENPDKPWDWSGISYNPNLTMDTIKENPDKSWNWSYISYNPNITMDIIKEPVKKPWLFKIINLKANIKRTVWHEIAHHFGMNEREVRAAERLRRMQKLWPH